MTATSNAGPNVDPVELAKFGDVAHRWWDTGSEFRPLHEMNPVRLAWIEDVTGGLAERRVLDVGCGGGILAESMAARGRAGDRHRPVGEGARRRAPARTRIRRSRRLPAGRRPRRSRPSCPRTSTSSPAWSCWSTCPIRRRSSPRARRWRGRAASSSFATINRDADRLPARGPRRGVRAATAAARHARLGEVHPSRPSSRDSRGVPVSISPR